MTIRLGFNARLLAHPEIRGWNRYALELLAALPAHGVEPILFADRPIDESHRDRLGARLDSARVSPPMPYPAWEQAWLPRQCRLDRVDVLHCPFHFGLPWFSPCPRVLTLHDAIDFARGGLKGRGALRSRIHHAVARSRAERIITVSDHARGDLIRRLGIPPSRIAVIPEAAAARFAATIDQPGRDRVRRDHAIEGPYLFYVGGWEARKNLPFLARAFALASVEGVSLVLAGGRDEEKGPMLDLARTLGIADRLRLLGFVPEADLPGLYAEALAFAYPSEHEGFGLQLCEAMAAGCPTLAADATSLPGVLGRGGETFPIDDPAILAGLIRRVARDPEYRRSMARRARERSADFSWDAAARATAEVYREVLRPKRA